ncbi:MAG: ATP-binding protein [Chloroflexota bacterium]
MLDLAATLERSDTFHGLPLDDLEAVAGICIERTCDQGAIVFSEGEPAKDLYIVLEGKVALEKAVVLSRRGSTRRATVDVATSGQAFGWSAVVAPYEMTASAVCVEPCRVLQIDGEALRELLRERPTLGYEVTNRLARIAGTRLRDTTHRLTYLLSIASHDLKAPLAAVESYLQVMIGGFAGPLTDKQHQMLLRCSERIKEALDLISNFLDVSRLEAGQMYKELEIISFTNVVRRTLDVVRPAAQEKGVELEASVPDDLPGIQGAALRLQQVLVNLLSNAIKFTPSGGLVTLAVEDTGEWIRVEVVDTGVGVPPEDLPHVFEDFYRGSNVSDSMGTGLGLPIAKRIVTAHGGRIWAESPVQPAAETRGSRFVFELPRRSSST